MATGRGHRFQGCRDTQLPLVAWVWENCEKMRRHHTGWGQLTWDPAGRGRSLAAAMARSPGVSEEDGNRRILWGQ